jgi:hypothetical protein
MRMGDQVVYSMRMPPSELRSGAGGRSPSGGRENIESRTPVAGRNTKARRSTSVAGRSSGPSEVHVESTRSSRKRK